MQRAAQQEALGSSSQQDLMSDHGAAQHLPVVNTTRSDELPLQAQSVSPTVSLSKVPESGEPLHPQQRAWGQLGQSLGEEEERNGAPVLGAQLLDHLQQGAACGASTAVRNRRAVSL